ncbi:hypothetical protein TYRP_001424 [Tyrophagus putrescentiae]|nr:hypothetical protein TYRP_001424 [Tyrophagus putrescentiae]
MLIFLLTAASTLADSSATSAQLPHLQAAKLPKLQSHEQKDVPSKKEVVLVRRKRLTSFTHFAQRVILVSLLELAKRTAQKKILPALRRLLLKVLLMLGFASAGVIIGGGSFRMSKRFSPVLVNVTKTTTRTSSKKFNPETGFRGFRRTLFLAIDEHASVLLGLFVLASLASLLLGFSCLKAKRANDRRIVANAAALIAKRLRKRRAAEAAKKRKMLEELKRRRKREKGSTTSIWKILSTRSAAFFTGSRRRRRR